MLGLVCLAGRRGLATVPHSCLGVTRKPGHTYSLFSRGLAKVNKNIKKRKSTQLSVCLLLLLPWPHCTRLFLTCSLFTSLM
ncbi:hypothetical protein E2C01_087677 [Portunus trituberculatus]|uniref:Uncharacterized protein n=1 Tax=Portunus trituberculatus TaxID=210409 RepID=A0A5B7J458_PORTR|nr:hypothetical protein [Portunus trituberculatus]